jgi:hypothetical protein
VSKGVLSSDDALAHARASALPVAVKASALTVAANIARPEPDLMAELRLAVANQLPTARPGFRCRVEKELGLPRKRRKREANELNQWLTN